MSNALKFLTTELIFGITFLHILDYIFIFIENFFIIKVQMYEIFTKINRRMTIMPKITYFLNSIVSNYWYKQILKIFYRFRFVIKLLGIYAFSIYIVTKISRLVIIVFEFLLYLPINFVIYSFKYTSLLFYKIIVFVIVNPKYILFASKYILVISSFISIIIMLITFICFLHRVTEIKQTYDEKKAISKLKFSTILKIKIKIIQLKKKIKFKKEN